MLLLHVRVTLVYRHQHKAYTIMSHLGNIYGVGLTACRGDGARDTPVNSIGPETHAKHFALPYPFDLVRVLPQYRQSVFATLCPESS
jgi:hypothetical protein